jgi:hypothetical protein
MERGMAAGRAGTKAEAPATRAARTRDLAEIMVAVILNKGVNNKLCRVDDILAAEDI